MARKPRRIKLNRKRTSKGDEGYKVALIYPADHANIPTLADRLIAAQPGTKVDQVADLAHEAFVALAEKLAVLEGA